LLTKGFGCEKSKTKKNKHALLFRTNLNKSPI